MLRHGFTLALAVAASVVALGLLPLPYGYYTLLRLVLATVAAYGLYLTWNPTRPLTWVLLALLVLYNPVLPVRLADRTLWAVVNLATLAVFWRVRQTLR